MDVNFRASDTDKCFSIDTSVMAGICLPIISNHEAVIWMLRHSRPPQSIQNYIDRLKNWLG